MAASHVGRVRQGLLELNEALARGEMMDPRELFAPEVEWQESAQLIDRGSYRGYDGLAALFADVTASFSELRLEVDEIFDAGADTVVELGHFRGVIGGVAVSIRCVHVFTFRDDRVVKVVEYEDAGAAARAAPGGLPAASDP